MALTEVVEAAFALGRPGPQKPSCGGLQQWKFPADHVSVIDLVRRPAGSDGHRTGIQVPALHQLGQADQQRVSGHRTERRVGGVSQARRAEGKDLPQRLSCANQEVDKAIGLLAE